MSSYVSVPTLLGSYYDIDLLVERRKMELAQTSHPDNLITGTNLKVRLPSGLVQLLEAHGSKTKQSIEEIITQALEEYLD